MSYLFPTYARWDVEPEYAKGCNLIDKNGKTYLDFTSGIGVLNLGHQPLEVKAAVQKQLDRFWHVSNLFIVGEQEVAAEMLAKASGMNAVFFANSGAEANEGAIKLARKATGKSKIITFHKSFHGRTFATMAATGQDKVKQGFGPMLEKFVYVPFNDIESLKKEMDDTVAAVMLEMVQGEGGVHVGNHQFLKETEALCRQYGALLIVDEVQTGIGRTGKPFAFQHFDLQPDIVTAAKALGNGFPIGAVLGKEYLKEYFGPGSHGSTFGGNPISIAAAIETMKIIFQDGFLEDVQSKGQFFKKTLADLFRGEESVKDVRGLGLMIGIELQIPVQEVLTDLRSEGLFALSAGDNVLRLLPPLIVTKEEIEKAIKLIDFVLKKHSRVA